MARRSAPLLLSVALAATACPGSDGRDLPPAGATSTPGALESAAIREAVVRFLDAYARSGTSVELLDDRVAGPDLRNWVHWVGVQNRNLMREASGEVDLRTVTVLRIDEEVAAAAVEAGITLTFVSRDGQRGQIHRTFQSPALLIRVAEGSWAVVDVVRDGRSMTDAISVLDPPVAARRAGLAVEAVSVFRFTSGTVVNVRLRNTGARAIRIDREGSSLHVGGRVLVAMGMTRSLARPLRPQDEVEGAFDFPEVRLDAVPEVLLLRLEGNPRPISLAFPPDAFASGA